MGLLAEGGRGGCRVATLCVCAIFTLFQYYTYIKLSSVATRQADRQTRTPPHALSHRDRGMRGGCLLCLVFHNWDRVRFGFVFAFGFEFGFGFASWAGGSRLRPLQVCTSNVRKLNFSWLPQMLVSVSVCVHVCSCVCVCVLMCVSVDYSVAYKLCSYK